MTGAEGAVKRGLFGILYRSGVVRLVTWRDRRAVQILCYHGVTGSASRLAGDAAGLHVRVDRFKAQLGYLRRRYRVISLREYIEARRRGSPLPPYTAVLTFDDGYRNCVTVAAPALKAMGMPATFFLVTDWVDQAEGAVRSSQAWDESDDRSHISWDEATTLSSAGFEIGSHTRSHAILTERAPDDAREEMAVSLAAVRQRLALDEVSFAYPKGAYDDWVVDLARELGYGCALTTDGGGNDQSTDLFRLRRTLVGDDDDVAAFAARICGLGYRLSRAQARLRP